MAKDFNNPVVVDGYDQHIRKLIPAYEFVHLQILALLKTHAEAQSKVLVVGCGTGYELQQLAQQFPNWKFTAIDPAANMLEKAKQHVEKLGLSDRVQFIYGDTSILKKLSEKFDVALAILVSHFVQLECKAQFFQDIADSLDLNGICLSYELTQIKNQKELESLCELALETGLSEKQVQVMAARMEQDFSLVSVEKMQNLYLNSGFKSVNTFSQTLNYYGFIGFKTL